MRHGKFLTIGLGVMCIMALACPEAAAQRFQGLNTLKDLEAAAQDTGKYIIDIAFVFTGIIGGLMLIPALIKALKGEPQTRDAITVVGLGLIASFIILAIIKTVMSFT